MCFFLVQGVQFRHYLAQKTSQDISADAGFLCDKVTVFSDTINWTDNLQYSGNVKKGIAQNTLALYEVMSRNRNTTENTNHVASFKENIAVYHEDNMKYGCTLWPQCRYSL